MTASEDGSQAAYVALAEHRPELASQPGVIALPRAGALWQLVEADQSCRVQFLPTGGGRIRGMVAAEQRLAST